MAEDSATGSTRDKAPTSTTPPALASSPSGSSTTVVCCATAPDRPGLLGALGQAAASAGGNVTEAVSHADDASGRFVARLVVTSANPALLSASLSAFPGSCSIHPWPPAPVRAAVLCSRPQHAAAALLAAAAVGELPLTPVALISDLSQPAALAERLDLDFHHLPIGPGPQDRAAQESALAELIESLDVELVVLARYMRVLPAFLCERWYGAMVNIHHSLLPSFVGADPYRRAYERGVKLVGATAHYVTAELDAGPIIAQDVAPVSYLDGPTELATKGAAVESRVLLTALRAHLARRVFIVGDRTVVLG